MKSFEEFIQDKPKRIETSQEEYDDLLNFIFEPKGFTISQAIDQFNQMKLKFGEDQIISFYAHDFVYCYLDTPTEESEEDYMERMTYEYNEYIEDCELAIKTKQKEKAALENKLVELQQIMGSIQNQLMGFK